MPKGIYQHPPQCGFQKGNKIWVERKHTTETKEKIGEAKEGLRDEETSAWKGDNAKKKAMHNWVYRHKGKPKICEDCEATAKERKLVWSNKDHTYKRKLEDYIARCYPCHRIYDLRYN